MSSSGRILVTASIAAKATSAPLLIVPKGQTPHCTQFSFPSFFVSCASDQTSMGNDEDGDDDWYQKEMNEIAAKKEKFFSSLNCNKERNGCMKCCEGGQLLMCSSESCSFVFHERCSEGNLYCPFCKYSQLLLDYRIVRIKASLARNDVANFNGLMLKCTPQMSHQRLCVSDHNKPCTKLPIPQRRRVPVPWTQLEEDTLKLLVVALQKWMEKLSGGGEGGFIPWRRILELGVSVFQKSRTPADLKDKWRNMQKATKNST
ncbi:hypothetical protein LXL04_022507 [Taraxacum kok-saghyz]